MNQDQACPKRVWGVRYTYQSKPILWVDVCRKDLVSPLRIDRPRNCFGKINGKGFPIFQRKRATLSFLFLYGRWLQQWCSKHSRCFLPLSHCQGEVLLMTNFDPIRKLNFKILNLDNLERSQTIPVPYTIPICYIIRLSWWWFHWCWMRNWLCCDVVCCFSDLARTGMVKKWFTYILEQVKMVIIQINLMQIQLWC